MSHVQAEYYRNNRVLMSFVGVWPYQSRASTCVAFLLYFLIAGSQFYCKVAFAKLAWPDPIVLVECTTPIFVDLLSVVKLLNLLINTSKIKIMLDEIINGYGWSPNSKEAAIMQNYTRHVEKTTFMWMCYLYTTLVLYNSLPLVPQILGTLGNKTRDLPIPVHYPVNIDNYYYPVFAHGFFAGYVFTTGIIAADTIFILFVQHACGLFAVLGYKLENAVTEIHEYVDLNPRKSDDSTYKNFSACIEHHVKAIKFVEMIESVHKTAFLLSVGINMIIISITGAQMVNNLDEIHLLFRQSAMIASLMSHLFIENFYAQKLSDHSIAAYTDILESNWYRASLRTKRLLIMFVSRSLEPSVLTIGGLYVMSLETFSLVLRTSVSYFTVLLSMQ